LLRLQSPLPLFAKHPPQSLLHKPPKPAASIAEQYPWLEQNGVLDVLIPKKEPLFVAKWCVFGTHAPQPRPTPIQPTPTPLSHTTQTHHQNPLYSPNHVSVAVVHQTPLFFSEREGRWMPTMRVLHQYPEMMPKLRADQGAIKFVLSGANIMCPGLTSPGATIHDEVPEGAPVAIYAEGKEHAMAVGLTKLSTADIRAVNKGVAVELMHHLNDGLWKARSIA
jgi:predicted RNA-binding protein (TIGR00451 family)